MTAYVGEDLNTITEDTSIIEVLALPLVGYKLKVEGNELANGELRHDGQVLNECEQERAITTGGIVEPLSDKIAMIGRNAGALVGYGVGVGNECCFCFFKMHG